MPGVSLLEKWNLLQVALRDDKLSPVALKVFVRLLHHLNTQTRQCSPSYGTLAEAVGISRRSAIRAVGDLRAAGWIVCVRAKRDGTESHQSNSFRVNFDRVAEAPQVVTGPSLDGDETVTRGSDKAVTRGGDRTGTSGGDNSVTSGSDDTVTRGSDKAVTRVVTGPSPRVVTRLSPKYGKIETGKGNREESPPTPSRFDEWWEAYPRKVGKQSARSLFDRIVSKDQISADDLVAGARRYAAERAGQDPQFTKHPKTWLNGGCWDDECAHRPAEPSRPRGSGRGGFSATRDWLPDRMLADD